jgi:hypothetical protein
MNYAIEFLKAQLQREDMELMKAKCDHFHQKGTDKESDAEQTLTLVAARVSDIRRALQILDINERGVSG